LLLIYLVGTGALGWPLAVVLLVIFLVAFYYYLSTFFTRLNQIIFRVEEIAAGGLHKLDVIGHACELDQLASALNDLVVKIKSGAATSVSRHKALSQAKNDFVTVASHQLRTPLSIIKWYIDYVISGDAGELNAEQKKYLDQVYVSNERLIDLVNSLLDVSRIDLKTFSIDPESMNLTEKAQEMAEKNANEAKKKNIRIETEFGAMPVLNFDPRLIGIVFDNLLSNAIKYTPNDGFVKFVVKKADEKILIKVVDSGIGIPSEYKPKMFSKFFRSDESKKMDSQGTGLGLYIVKSIVEKAGGKIWYESPSLENVVNGQQTESHGTAFFISFPASGMKRREGKKKLGEA